MAKLSARHFSALTLILSAILVIVIGVKSQLSTGAVIAVSLIFLFFAILVLRNSRPVSRAGTKFWIIFIVGVLFLIGGAAGIVRSIQEDWRWAERFPLAVPFGLGLSIIWFCFKKPRDASS